MGRKPKPPEQRRVKLNLTIHPEIREWAQVLMRRRSISQLFEDLVEAEWMRQQAAMQALPPQPSPAMSAPSPYFVAPTPQRPPQPEIGG